jgi:hypothetical protein
MVRFLVPSNSTVPSLMRISALETQDSEDTKVEDDDWVATHINGNLLLAIFHTDFKNVNKKRSQK